ncbi:hypothetical protein BM1_08332 [Bipolaris maydis]|nr:hypothetical protein BM1_08332 [Bipolaris maydis]
MVEHPVITPPKTPRSRTRPVHTHTDYFSLHSPWTAAGACSAALQKHKNAPPALHGDEQNHLRLSSPFSCICYSVEYDPRDEAVPSGQLHVGLTLQAEVTTPPRYATPSFAESLLRLGACQCRQRAIDFPTTKQDSPPPERQAMRGARLHNTNQGSFHAA